MGRVRPAAQRPGHRAAQRPGHRAAQRPGHRAAQRPARQFRPPLLLGALTLVLYGLGAIGIGKPLDGLSIFALAITALGLIIARRQPGNSVAWLLLGLGPVLAFYENAANYAVLDYHFHHGRLPLGPAAAVVAAELWSTPFLMLPLVILLFPDGKLSSRWRLILRAYLAACALLTAIWLAGGAWEVSTAPIVVDGKGQLVSNPGPPGVPVIAFAILLIAVAVFWLLFVLRQVLSWRQATGERRAQLKWLMAGGSAAVAGLAFTVLLSSDGGLLGALDNVMLAFGLFSLPVCIVFAILKYRLYDIDRLISRTLSYTLVTGLLVGVYTGLVLLTTQVLRLTSPVGVAAATLAVAALFNPVRRRVQRMVDRRFNRARYDSDRTVAGFASRLKDEVDLDSVRADLTGAVQHALEPAHITLWLSPDAAHAASPADAS
jgi:hypothetical protein